MIRSRLLVCGVFAAAMLVATPSSAAPPADLDQEAWAGISYRDTIVGVVALGTGAAVVSFLTGSTILSLTAAAAIAGAFIVFDPGAVGVTTPSDVPTLPQLGLRRQESQ